MLMLTDRISFSVCAIALARSENLKMKAFNFPPMISSKSTQKLAIDRLL
jgi:hypothetical protein